MMRPLPLLIMILALLIGAAWWWSQQQGEGPRIVQAPQPVPIAEPAVQEMPPVQATPQPSPVSPNPAPVSEAAAQAEQAVEAELSARNSDTGPNVPASQPATQVSPPAVSPADLAAQIESLLTPQGLDAATASALIEQSALTAPQKATLMRLIETAAGNPDILRAALRQMPAVMP